MVGKIEKLLRKVSKKDRKRLLEVTEKLIKSDKKNLNIQKLKNTDFYRLKEGQFRIIFHFENREVIVDSIKLRGEKTYKNL